MIEIRYCVRWDYYPRAVSLAAIIQEHFHIDIKLSPGEIGELSVYWNDERLSEKGDSIEHILEMLQQKSDSDE